MNGIISHMSDKKNPSLAWIIKELINPSLSNRVTDGNRHLVISFLQFITTSGPNFLFESKVLSVNFLNIFFFMYQLPTIGSKANAFINLNFSIILLGLRNWDTLVVRI